MGRFFSQDALADLCELQVLERGNDVSFMDYKVDKGIEDAGFALFHNMDELQYKGTWARFWSALVDQDLVSLVSCSVCDGFEYSCFFLTKHLGIWSNKHCHGE